MSDKCVQSLCDTEASRWSFWVDELFLSIIFISKDEVRGLIDKYLNQKRFFFIILHQFHNTFTPKYSTRNNVTILLKTFYVLLLKIQYSHENIVFTYWFENTPVILAWSFVRLRVNLYNFNWIILDKIFIYSP